MATALTAQHMLDSLRDKEQEGTFANEIEEYGE